MKFSILIGVCGARSRHLSAVDVRPDGSLSASTSATSGTSTRRQRLEMLQTQAEGLLATKLSPDAKKVIVDVLLPTLDNDIEASVLREFTTVQELLKTEVGKVEAVASTAQSHQQQAVTADTALDTCRSEQRTAMQDLEKCVADREAKIIADSEKCKQKQQAAKDTCDARDVAAQITFTPFCRATECNLADGGSCGVAGYKTIIDGMVAEVADKERIYNGKVAACAAAETEAADVCAAAEQYASSDSCLPKREVLSSKTAACDTASASAGIAICSFGDLLQTKCGDLTEVEALVAKIRASNRQDDYSEPDRQAEWAAIQRLKCLLEALRDDGDMSTSATQTCADSRPYPKTFDYLDARIAGLACNHPSFSFSGYSWIMGQTADQCVRSEASLEFTAAADKAPFALCDQSQTCAFTVTSNDPTYVFNGAYVRTLETHNGQPLYASANDPLLVWQYNGGSWDMCRRPAPTGPSPCAGSQGRGGNTGNVLQEGSIFCWGCAQMPRLESCTSSSTELLIGEGKKLVANTNAGEVQASQNYEVSFLLTPHGTLSGWTNIIHFTQTGKNCCDEGDRMPAVWFYSSTTKLHIRSSRQGGGNDGCDPTDQLPIGQATKVDIRVEGGKMQVFFSGNKVCETNTYSSPTSPSGTMVAWAGDPWHPASDATLAHLSYTRL